MGKLKKRLGDLLIEAGLISYEQLEQALTLQEKMGKRLGKVLMELGYISGQSMIEVLEFQLGVPRMDLNLVNIDAETAGLIPEAVAKRYQVIPIRRERNKVVLAVADPTNIFAIDDVQLATGLPVEVVMATESEIERAINRAYGVRETVQKAIQQLQTSGKLLLPDDITVAESDSPMISIVNSLLQQAAKEGASDIHIEPQEKDVRVRFRVDGVLREIMFFPKRLQGALTSRLKIMSDMDISERRIPQDGRFKLHFTGRGIDIRISTLPTIYGEKIVGRLLDQGSALLDIEKLGFAAVNMRRFKDICQKPCGLVLVTGPTGSGKTTTLYSALSRYSTTEKNIITVEDPVEYRLPGINQVNINHRAGLDFANTLRAILRQDPNIIMVGEIRDLKTAEIALRAALTGHLVLSTLHTNDASSAVTRLVDMGMEAYLVASSVSGILSQRLVRCICRQCKTPYGVEPNSPEYIFVGANHGQPLQLYRGMGCLTCNHTGYRGRVGIHEVLPMTADIRALIMQGGSADVIAEAAKREGMLTMVQDGLQKALAGITTLAEVMRVAYGTH